MISSLPLEQIPFWLNRNSLRFSASGRIFSGEPNSRFAGKCSRANPVLIESGFALFLFVLSHFLTAKRFPLRLKML